MEHHTNMHPEPTTSGNDRERLLDLAAAYCDDLATEQEVAELQSLIESSDAACRHFLTYTLVHGQLPLVAEPRAEAIGIDAAVPVASPPRIAGSSLIRGAAVIAAVVASLGLVAWLVDRGEGPGPAPAVATLTDARFVVLADQQPDVRVGQSLAAGRFAIRSGAAKLTLANGVTLVLDGPADVELVDEMRALLHDGSVVVRVPKGMSGFRLGTTTAEILDLGTEFAVRAGNGLVTDVQVYEGAVIASQVGEAGFPRRVEAGTAVRLGPEVAVEPEEIPFVEERFLRALPPEPASGEEPRDEAEDLRKFGKPRIDAIRVSAVTVPPTIDGQLDDWPQGHAFTAHYAADPAAREWVEGRMAYDREHLYVAARVGDPYPLRSQIDPHLDPEWGWQGGAVQVRISTDRVAGWPVAGNSPGFYWERQRAVMPTKTEKAAATNPRLNQLVMWHHAPSGRACLSIAHGMMHTEHAGNPARLPRAFAVADDGQGYVLEYAIPWSLLAAADDPPRSGDTLAAAWQVHFADESGQIWRRQIIEIRNPGEPYRIGVWQRAATWGRAEYE